MIDVTMERESQMKDWQFRYQAFYRIRRTKKQKQRFLSSLAMDISQVRKDIQVIEYKQNKRYVLSNLYVGDIETADKIICTYYDTPQKGLGAYYFQNREKQKKSVISFILLSSLAALIIGALLTVLYMANSPDLFSFSSTVTIFVIAGYGIYFYLFSKIAQGLSSRKNLIRNTSSIVSILMLIKGLTSSKIAFAFLDEGCHGDVGLEILMKNKKKSAQLYSLDCVGANVDLQFTETTLNQSEQISENNRSLEGIHFIMGARISKDNHFYLLKSDLNSQEMNSASLETILNFFSEKEQS